jgi:MarR family 2-MHQ and catechol resistance regulon transcriptional repressor
MKPSLSPQQKAIIDIRLASNHVGQVQTNFMLQYGLTMPQFNILRILRGAKGSISINMLKQRMIEKSPNTTRLLDKLIEKGLIQRSRSNLDKRVLYLEITAEGLMLLEKIDADKLLHSLLYASLSDKESEQLSKLLNKVCSTFLEDI